MNMKTQMMTAALLALLSCGAQTAPFGVRLGEGIADPVPALTAENLESLIVTNGIPEVMPSSSWPTWERRRDVELSRPLMGVSRADGSVDQDGVCYQFSVNGNFRRGLAREESLRKIEALRTSVERECGFKLNDYSFSARRSGGGLLPRGLPRTLGRPRLLQDSNAAKARARMLTADTVAKEGCGPELWMDLDGVYAESVTTHDGMRVSIVCCVNTTTKDAPSGIDSPVGVSVEFLLVDVLRKAEARANGERELVAARQAAAKSAVITEIFGVELGKPSQWPTNELKKVSYETWTSGDNDEKKDRANVHYWRKDIADPPVPFVNRMFANYSLETLRLCSINGSGRAPKDIDRQEAIRRLDAFVIELNKKFGILMNRWPRDNGSGVQYDFSNDRVRLYLRLDFAADYIDFDVDDLTVKHLVRKEGWEAIPQTTSNDASSSGESTF